MLPKNDLRPKKAGSNGTAKEKYSGLCSSVYQEILTQGDVASMPGWKREYNADYQVTTWTLTENKDSGRVGSNGQLVVKIIEDGGYDFIRHEDIDNRGQLICSAAERIIKNELPENHPARESLLQTIANHKAGFSSYVQDHCKFDIDKIRNKDTNHFDDKFEKGKLSVKQLLADVAVTVKEAKDQTGSNTNIKTVFAQIEQAEKDHISEHGRPAVMKIGMVGEPGKKVKMVSMQFPQGKETIPSSDRTGNYNTKLSNHVIDGSGTLTTDPSGKAKIQFDLMVDGHSSYTPITESDNVRRLHIGTEALREKIAAIASDMQGNIPTLGNDANNPIKVSLSTMMLLSPFNAVEKLALGKESESRQVEESALVLEILKNMKQPLELTGKDGKPIFVTFDATCMNLPVNATMKIQKKLGSSLQDSINAKGFVEFSQNMESSLSSSLDNLLANTNSKMGNHRKPGLSQEDVAFLSSLHNPKHFPKGQGDDLSELYQALSNNMKNYCETDDKSEKQKLGAEFKKIRAKITNAEKANTEKFRDVLEDRNELFTNVTANNLPGIYDKLDKMIANPTISSELKEHLLLEKRYLVAQELFFNKSYLDPNNAYKFQAMYLLSNEQIGRQIETFCKSGEDRTGWMRVTLLALDAFKKTNGRDPDFSSDKDSDNFHKNYLDASHELSASLENTGYNSAARGLQVAAKLTTTHKAMEFGKSMAVLAKQVFKGFMKASVNDDVSLERGSAAEMSRSSRFAPLKRVGSLRDSLRSSRGLRNSNRSLNDSRSSFSEDVSDADNLSRVSSSAANSPAQNANDDSYSDFEADFLSRHSKTANDRSSYELPAVQVPITNSVAPRVQVRQPEKITEPETENEIRSTILAGGHRRN